MQQGEKHLFLLRPYGNVIFIIEPTFELFTKFPYGTLGNGSQIFFVRGAQSPT